VGVRVLSHWTAKKILINIDNSKAIAIGGSAESRTLCLTHLEFGTRREIVFTACKPRQHKVFKRRAANG
jgi:hypothetical protein